MNASANITELSYAVINWDNETITWKPMGFTPKRANAINILMEDKSLPVWTSQLENIA